MTRFDLCTLGEQAGASILEVSSKVPAIAKVVILLNEFDAIPLREADLVGASGNKFI